MVGAMEYDLFVIGGGSGGVRAARIAAGLGARVGIAERRFWGGTCVNIGCVPKKLMAQGAELGAALTEAGGFGWQVRGKGHDFGAMMAAIGAETQRLSGLYRGILEGAGVTMMEGSARLTGAHTVAVNGAEIGARHIFLAVGGVPVRPEFPGAALCAVSDDVFTLRDLPRRVAILGSGYIAVEFACIFAGLGAAVDLIFRQPLPLRGFDGELREALAAALPALGVRLHAGRMIASVETAGAARGVTLSDGTGMVADFVLLATGRMAAAGGLGLEAAGVALSPSGAIAVDEGLRTSVPSINAIGDAVDQVNLTPVAIAHGHVLAERLFGDGRRDWNFRDIPSAVFCSPPIATVGLTEEQAVARGETEVFVGRFTPLKHRISGRAGRQAVVKLVVDASDGRVLGAHMLGEDAPEIVQGLAVAMTAGATKRDFDRTIGIHPTAAEEFVTLRQMTRRVGRHAATS